jgi:hypothetical protein
MQHTEELWLYMGTVSGGNDEGDIFQFTICVARFLISHVRFYPPFTLLLDMTSLPLFFSEYVYKILKTSPEVVMWNALA